MDVSGIGFTTLLLLLFLFIHYSDWYRYYRRIVCVKTIKHVSYHYNHILYYNFIAGIHSVYIYIYSVYKKYK